jgi:hypothetical protein
MISEKAKPFGCALKDISIVIGRIHKKDESYL